MNDNMLNYHEHWHDIPDSRDIKVFYYPNIISLYNDNCQSQTYNDYVVLQTNR